MMKFSLEHLLAKKQRELERILEILHEEIVHALRGSSSDSEKRGRILKVILFGSMLGGPGSTSRTPPRAIAPNSIC